MKKIILLVLLALSFVGNAQDKISVAFIPMSYDEEHVSKSQAKIIQETVINAFVTSKRFSVVDREKLEEIAKEKKLQRSADFMDSKETFKSGSSKGASFLIDGNIVSVRHNAVKGGFETSVNIQLKVLDVSTAEILATENISTQMIPVNQMIKEALKKGMSKEEQKAMDLKEAQLSQIFPDEYDSFMVSMQRLSDNVQKFTSMNFPMHLSIVEWDKKDKKKFIISAGYNNGIVKGQMIDIVKVGQVTIGDKTVDRRQVVGSAFVSSVDDANFSSAIIITGEKEVKKLVSTNAAIGAQTR